LAGWVLERRAARELDDPAVWRELLRGGDVFPGTTMRNGEQALALELIAERGRAGFYGGEVARALVSAVRDAGGVLTEDDLASFQAKEVEPLEVFALGRRVLTMPPPSTGGVALAQTLLILSAYDDQMRSHVGTGPFDADTPRDPVYLHALVESAKHAFADRARWMGDPEFAALPTRELIDPAYAFARANALHPERTLEPALYGSSPEDTARFYELNDAGTSHVSVVDRFGGAVAMTETINLSYGSRVVVPGYGFALNNQMDDFATRPGEPNAFGLVQSELNAPGPGKRPISSMSPTIVLDGAGVVAVAGGSGGPRIISGVTQSLLNVLLFDMEAHDAVTAPRVHHQWLPDVLQVEPGIASDEALVGALVERGHTVEEADRPLGAVQLIRRAQLRDAESGWSAASDGTRKGGEPAGR
jgi:gamma-glutamyltranspeptidase/glutathione hydrolase